MSVKFYIVPVHGCIEPIIAGPYASESERDKAALDARQDQDESDALFWLDIAEDGTPTIGAYSGRFFLNEEKA